MPIKVNLRHLENKSVRLDGQLSIAELDLMLIDEMVQPGSPVDYDLEVNRPNQTIIAVGRLALTLNCECVRCLRPLRQGLVLDPYEVIIPLEGEEAAPIENDHVDLTPYVREDILLAFPRHPVCQGECDRLPQLSKSERADDAMQQSGRNSAWDQLDKLKL